MFHSRMGEGMPIQELLSSSPVFSGLNETERNEFAELAIRREFSSGQWITLYGDIWPYLFILEQGAISAIKESRFGRTLIVLRLDPGEILWGLAFFQDNAPMPVSLLADEDCRIYLWSREQTAPVFLRNGRVSWELARLMATRMQHASDIVEELAFQPVTGRLARLLLDHYFEAVGDFVPRDLTLEEMAAQIGSTREMVCRQLYKFADEGAVEVNRTEFMIKDRALLTKMAEKGKG